MIPPHAVQAVPTGRTLPRHDFCGLCAIDGRHHIVDEAPGDALDLGVGQGHDGKAIFLVYVPIMAVNAAHFRAPKSALQRNAERPQRL